MTWLQLGPCMSHCRPPPGSHVPTLISVCNDDASSREEVAPHHITSPCCPRASHWTRVYTHRPPAHVDAAGGQQAQAVVSEPEAPIAPLVVPRAVVEFVGHQRPDGAGQGHLQGAGGGGGEGGG